MGAIQNQEKAYRGHTPDTPPAVAIAAFVERYGQAPAEAPFLSGTVLLVGPIPEPNGSDEMCSHANVPGGRP